MSKSNRLSRTKAYFVKYRLHGIRYGWMTCNQYQYYCELVTVVLRRHLIRLYCLVFVWGMVSCLDNWQSPSTQLRKPKKQGTKTKGSMQEPMESLNLACPTYTCLLLQTKRRDRSIFYAIWKSQLLWQSRENRVVKVNTVRIV